AVCLDGSTPHYYLNPGVDAAKLVVYFMHGGFCGRSVDECVHSIPYYTSIT
ncbi:unnamed protein product, partial [Amoebophrya sp. A25]